MLSFRGKILLGWIQEGSMLIKLFAVVLIAAFAGWLFFLLKQKSKKQESLSHLPVVLTPEVEAFSGDNQSDTQLDLAQAYIELHQYEKAKHLLKAVVTTGDTEQVAEARKMFAELLKQEKKLCAV